MKRIAKFEKVSLEQFTKDFDINTGLFPEEVYDGIKEQQRALPDMIFMHRLILCLNRAKQ